MTKNKFLAIVYADLFDFCLTSQEIERWSFGNRVVKDLDLNSKISFQKSQDFYYLSGRKMVVRLRQQRREVSKIKTEKARRVANILSKIPTVQAVFITGSVAACNASKESDIDLMLLTTRGYLWLTRLVVVFYLLMTNNYRSSNNVRDRICTNMFLDVDHLMIENKNIFTAHEVLQAKCVFDRKQWERRWFEENVWVSEFLPNGYKQSVNSLSRSLRKKMEINKMFEIVKTVCYWLAKPFEMVAYTAQLIYMFPKKTNESVGFGFAFFHPRNLTITIERRLSQRLLKLGR